MPDWWVAGPGVLYCRDCYREQAAIYGIAYACPPDVPLEDEEARCISCHRRPCPTCGLRIVNPGDEENGSDECGHCLLTTYTSRTWRVDVLAYHDHVEMAERWLRRHDELPNNGHWPSAMRTAFWREVETWAGKAAVEAFLIGERCGDSREQRREIPAELVRRTVASERVLALLRNEVARITR